MINAAAASPQPAAPNSASSSTTGSQPSPPGLNNMFLKLLVAQLQNQSPLNPMDPTQFVGQLAQFSELSEITQIEETLQGLAGTVVGSTHSNKGDSAAHKATTPVDHPPAARDARTLPAAELPTGGTTDASLAESWLRSKIEGVF